MEQISSLLHFDVAKYKDIFNILHKLEEDGAINEISNLFYKIFSSESKFALGELVKIQKERSESKMDLARQFESNLSLFKSNFYLIVQLLLENTFKVVVKENQEKVKDKSISLDNSEGFIPTIEDTQTPRQREKALTRKPDSPSNKSKKSISEKNNQSNETKKSKVNKNTNSSSVLKGMVNKDTVAKTTREYKDQDRENSLTQSQQLSGQLKKRDSKPLISPIQIPSEFNKVQGPASFSQSERKFMEINRTSPGPAFYDVNQSSPLHLKRSTSPTIGKAKKHTWVDIATKTASPGPGGLYPSHHFISK